MKILRINNMSTIKYKISDPLTIAKYQRSYNLDWSFQKKCILIWFIFFTVILSFLNLSIKVEDGVSLIFGSFVLTMVIQLLFVESWFRKYFYTKYNFKSVIKMRDEYLSNFGYIKAFRTGQYEKDNTYYYFYYPTISNDSIIFEVELYDYNKHDCEA